MYLPMEVTTVMTKKTLLEKLHVDGSGSDELVNTTPAAFSVITRSMNSLSAPGLTQLLLAIQMEEIHIM